MLALHDQGADRQRLRLPDLSTGPNLVDQTASFTTLSAFTNTNGVANMTKQSQQEHRVGGGESGAASEVAADETARLHGVTTGEHPVHRLERAALEYAKAAARSSGADIRADRYTGNRGARAAVLAAEARRHKIDCSTLLQCAANAFFDWSRR